MKFSFKNLMNWIPDLIGNDKMRRGFTLVELLVVIVIIGILGSVITASLGSARKQARDTKRVADVKNISQALEQYLTDKGAYPADSQTANGVCLEADSYITGLLVPNFLAAIPRDPMYDANSCADYTNPSCHCYVYKTTTSSPSATGGMALFASLEASSAQFPNKTYSLAGTTEGSTSLTLAGSAPGFSGGGGSASGWNSRAITINNPTASTLKNYVIKVLSADVSFASGEIRFANNAGTELPYWKDSSNNYWVNVDSINPTQDHIALWYNPSNSACSSSATCNSYDNTFIKSQAKKADGTTDTSLVAEYLMDEGSGQYVKDSTTPVYSNTSSLLFDGTAGSVTSSNNSNLDIGSGEFTIEAWVKPYTLTADNRVVTKFVYMQNGYAFNIFQNGRFYFGTWQSGTEQDTISAAGVIPVGQWTFIAVTFSGSDARLFKNGVEVSYSSKGTHVAPAASPASLQVGIGSGWPFNGNIDEVRIYKSALSSDTISRHYLGDYSSDKDRSSASVANTNRLVYYNFNEASGNAVDQWAAGYDGVTNTGTLASVVRNNDAPLPGGSPYFGSSLYFDGASNYIGVQTSSTLNITGEITAEAWVKPLKTGVWQQILGKGQSGAPKDINYDLWLSPTNTIRFSFGNGTTGSFVDSLAALPLGQWSHIVATITLGSVASVYVNGALSNSQSISTVRAGNNQMFDVGGFTGYFFKGLIDEVRIYSVAISSTLAAQHYRGNYSGDTAGTVKLYLPLSEATGATTADASGNGNNGFLVSDSNPNIFTGASFETDSNSDGLADSWSTSGMTGTYAIISPGVSGNAQKMSITSSNGGIYQGVPYATNTKYVAALWLKVESGSVICQDLNQHLFSAIVVNSADNGNQWKKYFSTASIASTADCCFHCYANGGPAVFYLDELSMKVSWTGGWVVDSPTIWQSPSLSPVTPNGGYFSQGVASVGFNGVDDWISLPVSSQTYAYTQEIWAYPIGNKLDTTIYKHAHCDGIATGSGGIMLQIKRADHSADSISQSISNYNLGQWNFIAAAVDLNSRATSLFVNGNYSSKTGLDNSQPFMIGPDSYVAKNYVGCLGSVFFSGLADSLRLFNRALSQSEIKAHYLNNRCADPAGTFDADQASGKTICGVYTVLQ